MSKSKSEQLVWAALHGEFETVVKLCGDPTVNVNWQDNDGITALFCACQEGLVAEVEHLLRHPKIDPHLASHNGVTPFLMACQNSHNPVASVLLADPKYITERHPKHDFRPL